MKTDDLMILALAGVAVWLMLKPRTAAGTVSPVASGRVSADNLFSTEIFNQALPGQAGWGWTYFTDGVAIGPDGSYYKNGQKVWSA